MAGCCVIILYLILNVVILLTGIVGILFFGLLRQTSPLLYYLLAIGIVLILTSLFNGFLLCLKKSTFILKLVLSLSTVFQTIGIVALTVLDIGLIMDRVFLHLIANNREGFLELGNKVKEACSLEEEGCLSYILNIADTKITFVPYIVAVVVLVCCLTYCFTFLINGRYFFSQCSLITFSIFYFLYAVWLVIVGIFSFYSSDRVFFFFIFILFFFF
jgi:hypothetical protein